MTSSSFADDATNKCNDSRYSVLCYEQVQRLHDFMEEEIELHGLGGCPPVRLTLKDWVQRVRTRLEADGVPVRDVRLNGGGASYIIGMDECHTYNDLDLLFGVDLSCRDTVDTIRRAVLECLHSVLVKQHDVQDGDRPGKRPLPQQLQMVEAYVSKQARIEHTDRWFLLSLGSQEGLTVELKFVDQMRRQFEFTVDSFQIILDSLIAFYKVQPSSGSISKLFYPTVVAEAASGCFEEAFGHLQRREICTRCPEQIRGGGLLKYCKLLVEGYLPARGLDVPHLEKYMCSRFFIDFPDARQQRVKIESYLAAHFPPADAQLRTLYLQVLADVVCNSTVCLMQQERRSVLNLISELLARTYFEAEAAAAAAAAAAGSVASVSSPSPPPPSSTADANVGGASSLNSSGSGSIGGPVFIRRLPLPSKAGSVQPHQQPLPANLILQASAMIPTAAPPHLRALSGGAAFKGSGAVLPPIARRNRLPQLHQQQQREQPEAQQAQPTGPVRVSDRKETEVIERIDLTAAAVGSGASGVAEGTGAASASEQHSNSPATH